MRSFKEIVDYLLDLLFPPICTSCMSVLSLKSDDGFCPECREKWNEHKKELCRRCGQPLHECWCGVPNDPKGYVDSERHLVQYQKGENSTVMQAIYRMKNLYNRRGFDTIAQEMFDAFFPKDGYDNAVITAVPRNKGSIRKYGHDQSFELGKRLAVLSGLEYVTVLIHKGNVKQKRLGRKEREINAQKSYGIINGSSSYLKDKTVILVDDVVTTGATVVRCAHLLKMRGAGKVVVFSVAKTV